MKKNNSEISAASKQVTDQGLSSLISEINEERRAPLFEALGKLSDELNAQDKALISALKEFDWVRNKVGTPENILGNEATKHGEIAEIAEVGVRRAQSLIQGKFPNAIWNAADRLGSADYGIEGVPVQSKFINGLNNGLRHVLEHGKKYPDFGVKNEGYYQIPKDQYSKIDAILRGETDGLNTRTVNAIQSKIDELEELKNRKFSDLVQPSQHKYSEVQKGKIFDTIENHEKDLENQNASLKAEINDKNKDNIEKAQDKAAPSMDELGKVTLTGAAVGAGLQFTISAYSKWKQDGVSPVQYSYDDWKKICGQTVSGATVGGLSATSLYAITNYSQLSAPFAAAVVSSGRAMINLTKQYKDGEISIEEYTDLSIVTCSEAGFVAVGAALGQTLIPIPVLGAVVGSSIARLTSTHVKELLGTEAERVLDQIESKFQDQLNQLNEEHQQVLGELESKLIYFSNLTTSAFDIQINTELMLLKSISLAEEYNVPDDIIIRTIEDVDIFILGSS